MHAYSFVYPNGYGTEPMVLFDPSHFVNFIKGNNKISLGFYKAFGKQDYEALKSGEPISIDLTKTEETYRKLYGYNGSLDDYVFEYQTPIYVYGLENAKDFKSSHSQK